MNDMKFFFYSVLSFMLFILFSLFVQVEMKDFGDWLVSILFFGFFYVVMINLVGDFLIKMCNISLGICSWLQVLKIVCEEGSIVVVLINFLIGVVVNKMVCVGVYVIDRQIFYNYSLEKFDEFDGIVIKLSGFVGIVYFLVFGQFEVSWFFLNGVWQVVEFLMNLVVEMIKRRKLFLLCE